MLAKALCSYTSDVRHSFNNQRMADQMVAHNQCPICILLVSNIVAGFLLCLAWHVLIFCICE